MAAAIVADNAAAAAPVLVLLAAHGWDVNAATLLEAVDASAKHKGGLKKAVLKGVLRSLNYTGGSITHKSVADLKALLVAPLLLARGAAAAAAVAAATDGDGDEMAEVE